MFTKIKRKGFAIIMAAVMTISIIPAIGVEQTEAASKNHVMETKVKFAIGGSGDDSCVLINDIVTKKNVEYGKNYSLEMKIYVPAQFMEKGGIVVEPYLDFWGGEDGRTYYGGGTVLRSENINKKSPVVKKYKDFYQITLSQSINSFYDEDFDDMDAPKGNGEIRATVRIVGTYLAYSGSIYFDNVKLVMDGETIASAKFEDKKAGSCSYNVNCEKKARKPKVVAFSGNALEVTRKSISVKSGKTTTIKANAMPDKLTYKSSNKKVVTVTKKGVVKGIRRGSAMITVKANGKTAKVKVTVK